MPLSIHCRTNAFAVFQSLARAFLLAFLLCSQSFAGIFFSHPRDGQFKFVSPSEDYWYYVNPDQFAFQTPDKWQHFMGNFLLAKPAEKMIGRWPTVALFSSVNILKEIEDGYREGASVRDLGVGFAGMLSSLSNYKVVCTFDHEKIIFTYFISFDSFGLTN
ncbi:MAG: hypothetical protein A2W25_01180 [candidate division Zixibacteria bacterium RBG_16_53_22]|nr:MAG: hypothetical protein A2W25_01180 [candidate division Zixibacteria bacterium RBG_16_53_22]